MSERLQKILASAGVASRRTSEQFIKSGRVQVDGVVVTELGTKADPTTQRITVDGRVLPKEPQRRQYIVLNKPKGVTCTVKDNHATRTVIELVDLPGKPALKPVGRLDMNSEGLILLSDDGAFIYHLTHPSFHVRKTYLATVQGTPPPEALAQLKAGVELDDGMTAPADKVRLVKSFPSNDTADVEIIIHEGRKRQVRRMFDHIEYPVMRLIRTHVGTVSLGGLPSGAWRHLTTAEIERLMEPSATVETSPRPKPKRIYRPQARLQKGTKTDGKHSSDNGDQQRNRRS